jgi:hypothetical protein
MGRALHEDPESGPGGVATGMPAPFDRSIVGITMKVEGDLGMGEPLDAGEALKTGMPGASSMVATTSP